MHRGLTWALEHDPETALRLSLSLAPWWLLRGRWTEGYTLLTRAVVQVGQQAPGWSSAHVWLARLAGSLPDMHHHCSLVTDALSGGPPSSDLVDALIWRSVAGRNIGRVPQAEADAQAALELARRISHPGGEAAALAELALAALYENRSEEAVEWARQARLADLGRAAPWDERRALRVLPFALNSAGHFEGAQELCQEILDRARTLGDRGEQADVLFVLAQLARGTGRLAEAGAHLAASAEVALGMGSNVLRLVDILDEGALECAATGRPVEAVTLWSAVHVQNMAAGIVDPAESRQRRAPWADEAHRVLDAEQARVAQQRGAAMTLTAAVEFAVMMTGPDAPGEAAASPALTGLLSARERELVALVAQGKTDAEIAEKLFISVSTVRTHLDRIRDKSGYRRRADLTRLALREGIV